MTDFFISTAGSDASNGLGPDASAGTNKPWLTLGKAMNTGSSVAPGDRVFIGPGYYFSSGVTPISGITSAGSPTQFIGDPTNVQGFKDGSGVRLAPAEPWITLRTSGEGIDGTPATTGHLINAVTNKPSGLQFKFLVLEVRSTLLSPAAIYTSDLAVGTDLLFEDCYLIGCTGILYTGTPTAGRNHTFRRCDLLLQQLLEINTLTAAATADADLNILAEECWLLGGISGANAAIGIGASGGNVGGGIRVYDSTLISSVNNPSFYKTTALRVSTVTPCRIGGCNVLGGAQMNAGTAGHIVDDGYCRFMSNAHTNFTLAGTSFNMVAPNLNLPHRVKWGLDLPRAEMLGWSSAAHANQKFSAYARTTPDYFNRTPRPWGAGSTIGGFQIADLAQDATSAITGGGVNSAKITGAGELSIRIPVDAAATTVSIYTKSTSYGGTNYPQLIVQPNPDIGVTQQTATASSASEQQISTGSFTPTAKGVVEVRLISRSSSVSSTTNFDLLAA